jgi:hypothetical protein
MGRSLGWFSRSLRVRRLLANTAAACHPDTPFSHADEGQYSRLWPAQTMAYLACPRPP